MPCGCRGSAPTLTPEQEAKFAAQAEERARAREERRLRRETDIQQRRELREAARRAAIQARMIRRGQVPEE